MKRYDVESELNPAYQRTGNMADYYGVYHVIQIDEDGTSRRILTMPHEYGAEARNVAYRIVGVLSELAAQDAQ